MVVKEVHCAMLIALFTVTLSHSHYNAFERECEAISGRNGKIARNCLTSTIKYIVMQIRKGNCEKGYYNYKTHVNFSTYLFSRDKMPVV